MAINKREVGKTGEETAQQYLETQGYHIIEKNYRCRIGEIDIIAWNKGYLVFIEVKYRKNLSMGSPFDAINRQKQQTIRKAASYYMLSHHYGEATPCRFDAVGILNGEITLMKDIF